MNHRWFETTCTTAAQRGFNHSNQSDHVIECVATCYNTDIKLSMLTCFLSPKPVLCLAHHGALVFHLEEGWNPSLSSEDTVSQNYSVESFHPSCYLQMLQQKLHVCHTTIKRRDKIGATECGDDSPWS